ncbi:MAG: biosynthetic arginine decarboxylase [Candidatus Sericytochromatia bacterium]|nr:biosynthetic arginine decarboxylase [Candidatus Sericytochromatia bacterium]
MTVDDLKTGNQDWTVRDSEQLYHILDWGDPYFKLNEAGRVSVDPSGEGRYALDLYDLVCDIQRRGLNMPLLIRFSDILADRIRRLNEAFRGAIAEYSYPNEYRGVFPVKVCQQRHVVEEIVRYGGAYQYGLEAGSKPELLIALATLKTPGALVICNGYKDSEYIETALLAQRLGLTTIVVIEKLNEVHLVLAAAKKLGIKPLVGVRAKLAARGIGRWGDSVGDRAKFGLSAAEIMEVVETLKAHDMLDALQLLHFHVGSQISNISVIKNAMREASQFFVHLAKLGAPMNYLDVGGGLGIDYDGSKTNFHASKNYNIEEYAADVVGGIQDACVAAGVTPPILISESGRAITSHQSVLVFDVLGVGEVLSKPPVKPTADDHQILHYLYDTWEGISKGNLQEAYHDASQFKEEALSLFTLGYLTLEQRARAEELFWACCRRILPLLRTLKFVPEELADLEQMLATTYYCNFSVFQSAPDNWAIDQLFPIMPIHRLNERPEARGTLADLTCDSDGKIDDFIDIRDVKHALELHPWREGEPYYLGMFLNGAYQEILGNLHNLFGDTNTVHVHLAAGGEDSYTLEHVVKGDTMREVLRYMQYDDEALVESIRKETERALRDKRITISEQRLLLRHYERALAGYTYLWSEE